MKNNTIKLLESIQSNLKEDNELNKYVVYDRINSEKTNDRIFLIGIRNQKNYRSWDRNDYYINSYPEWTTKNRNNFDRTKLFSSREAAETFMKKNNLEGEIITTSEMNDLLAGRDELVKQANIDKEEKRKNDRKKYYEYNKEIQAEKNKKYRENNPGKYRVFFRYANSYFDGEVFYVNAYSINDAFNQAKKEALSRNPSYNTPGYDEKLVFSKDSIYKVEE